MAGAGHQFSPGNSRYVSFITLATVGYGAFAGEKDQMQEEEHSCDE
jgi:hypothetical protein